MSPTVRSSCRGCSRRWTGLSEAHCPSCHEHFGSVDSFDVHRVGPMDGDRRCIDPASLRRRDGNPVLVAAHRGLGRVWRRWSARPHYRAESGSAERCAGGAGHPALNGESS